MYGIFLTTANENCKIRFGNNAMIVSLVFPTALLSIHLLCTEIAVLGYSVPRYKVGQSIPFHAQVSYHTFQPLLSKSELISDGEISGAETKGTASIPNLATSLVKSIVGAGVLALPAGVTKLGDTFPQAIPTALLFIGLTGMMNAYFFSLLGRVCSATGAISYREAWDQSVGQRFPNATAASSIVTWTVSFKTALSCLAYSIILADSFQSLAMSAGFLSCTRSIALLGITVSALLPLCLLRDLSSLAPFSLAGLLGFGVTVVTMLTRLWDGSYRFISDGRFVSDLSAPFQPSFGSTTSLFPEKQGIVLLCTLATAFVAHYNAPRFHAELRDKSVPRFNRVVNISFAIAAALFAVVAVSGFMTFGSHSQPFILNNYSPYDPLAVASRLAIAVSIVLTFPLPFVGLRDGVLDAMNVSGERRNDMTITSATVLLLTTVTIAALLIQDLSLVLAVGGGTFSTAVSSVFPTLMFLSLKKEKSPMMESIFAAGLMMFSALIGVVGVLISLNVFSV
jgi:amino acid permease